MSTPRAATQDVVAELHNLVHKLAAFPDPSNSGREGAQLLGRITTLVFDPALDDQGRRVRLGTVMGLCLTVGKLLTLPDKPGNTTNSLQRKDQR